MKKLTPLHIITLAACAVMLLAFLVLPLVDIKSYDKPLSFLLRRHDVIVPKTTERIAAIVILAGMALSPVLLAVRAALAKSPKRWLSVLPLVFGVLLAAVLLISRKPVSPALGIWLYLVAALMVAMLHFRKNKPFIK